MVKTLINQITQNELKQAENSLRDVLEDLQDDFITKTDLLNHPRIILAEKLSNLTVDIFNFGSSSRSCQKNIFKA